MSYSNMVMEDIMKYSELEIIDAQKVHSERFVEIPETSFYKTLSRLALDGKIERVSKGIYCRPKIGRFGKTISNENDILTHFIGAKNDKGVVVGYNLFNKYGITTQISKIVKIYSSALIQGEKTVGNVLIQSADLKFDFNTRKMIELLEILQEFRTIEDLNTKRLNEYIKDVVQYYDEKAVIEIIKVIGYKKSTIASLKNVLDFFNRENTMGMYLNGLSKYNSLNMEAMYVAAQQDR